LIYEWRVAPGLDCYPFQTIVNFSDGARNETYTTSIVVGEPDEVLFAAPSGFVERSPKQVEEIFHRDHPGLRKWPDRVLEDVESRYQRHKARPR